MTWDVSAKAQKDFLNKLEKLEGIKTNLLTEYELQFIDSMREKWESREVADDLGIQRWHPSSRQLNYLSQLADKF